MAVDRRPKAVAAGGHDGTIANLPRGVESVSVDGSSLEHHDRRQREIRNRESFVLPSKTSTKLKAVVITGSVGQAGALIPKGTVVFLGERSADAHVRDGTARPASKAEEARAVDAMEFQSVVPLDRIMSGETEEVTLSEAIPGYAKDQKVPAAVLLRYLMQRHRDGAGRKPRIVVPKGVGPHDAGLTPSQRARRNAQIAKKAAASKRK